MSFDLTNKNIQDTFQNLLQKTGSDGRLYDLEGNQIRDLTIDGTLTANTYITSESIVNTSSGSTAFGNDDSDSHTFQGNITASGNISSSGIFYGDGSGLSNLSSAAVSSYTNNGNNRVITSVDSSTINGEDNLLFDGNGLAVTGNITASGDISSSANVFANDLIVKNEIQLVNTLGANPTIKYSDANVEISTGLKVLSGNLDVEYDATLQGGNLWLGPSSGQPQWELMSHNSGLLIRSASAQYLNITDEGNVLIGKDSTADSGQKLQVTGDISASGNIHAAQITASIISASGTIKAETIKAVNTFNIGSSEIRLRESPNGVIEFGGPIHVEANGGHITASGNISASGTIIGNDATFGETGITLSGNRIQYTAPDIKIRDTGLNVDGNITASGNISSSGGFVGDLTGQASTVENSLTAGTGVDFGDGTIGQTFNGSAAKTLNLDLTEVITSDGANRVLTSEGDGTLTAESELTYDGSQLIIDGNLSASGDFIQKGDGTGAFISASSGNIELSGSGTAELNIDGNITASGYLQTDSYIQTDSHITASGNISSSGNVITNQITASGVIKTSGGFVGESILGGSHSVSLSSIANFIIDARPDSGIEFNSTGLNADFDVNGENINDLIKVDASTDTVKLGNTGGFVNLLAPVSASGNISSSSDVIANRFLVNGKRAIEESSDELTLGFGVGGGTINLGRTNATPSIFTNGNITASGAISSSGTIVGSNLSGTNTGDQDLSSYLQNSDTGSMGNSIVNGTLSVNTTHTPSGSFSVNYGDGATMTGSIGTGGHGYGDITEIGGGTITTGRIHALEEDGDWALSGETGPISSSLLCIGLADGKKLLRGTAYVSTGDTTTIGQKVYGGANGRSYSANPSDSGDVVRVVGYTLSGSVGANGAIIYFNPDNIWVEVS